MNPVSEILAQGVEQLLGRASGPLHFRLIIQPIMATALAVRAGLRDAREGNSPFLWTVLTSAADRRMLIRSGWKDIGKLFVVAAVLDLIYTLIVLRTIHPVQTVIVCVCVAFVPYGFLRGTVTRIARVFSKSQSAKRAASA